MGKSLQGTVLLHNGVKMPYFGLGVYKVEEGNEVIDSVKTALEVGYRAIDTAALYENEEGVGKAIKESGIPRKEIFVTTKVWNTDHGYEKTLKAFDKSISKLGLDYVDLYLIHWPGKDTFLDTWRALEKLYRDGRVRAIGVSNFKPHHLQTLMEHSEEKPVINQVELHPYFQQKELREFCKQHDIVVEAWSPLGRGQVLDDPVLAEIGKKYGKTPAQVTLRWHLQNDIVIIPKSVTPSRIKENADIFDFELTAEDMEQIDQLDKNTRLFKDPDLFF
ncbi:aldo/keto reductase [Pallidibacillus thermolactis]|uniref:aldo/keto reductase n=1 Tax=Pallidibacillus thermolactis TaxID=251051 RepID=UPI0021D95D7A|nr:aldo/keto reductase [Pallidibacillus thermolactis]MCU9602135.1 aldo/keto reductase [Pallidibacillus thermolactis subsp. kokeshiiformis]